MQRTSRETRALFNRNPEESCHRLRTLDVAIIWKYCLTKLHTSNILLCRCTMPLSRYVILASIIAPDDIVGYDSAQDQDLYAYFLADDVVGK
jgi:hypothetical protein